MASVDHLSGLTAQQLYKLADRAKVKEENEKLAANLAKLPTILNHLKINKPSKTIKTHLTGGASGAFCKGTSTLHFYKVSFDDPQIPPKSLYIQIRQWEMRHWYLSGATESWTFECYIEYNTIGSEDAKKNKSWTVHSHYSDPGSEIRKSLHGGAKALLKAVLTDLDPSSTLTEMEFLDCLVTDSAKEILKDGLAVDSESNVGSDWDSQDGQGDDGKVLSLREVIEREIRQEEESD
jgi:hypothetical protein